MANKFFPGFPVKRKCVLAGINGTINKVGKAVTDLNWHNPGKNGNINTNRATIINKLEECFSFKEKLSNNEVSAGVNLLL